MTNDQRNTLCQKLTGQLDWQLPANPTVQSFLSQLQVLPLNGDTSSNQDTMSPVDRPMLGTQKKPDSGRQYATSARHVIWVGIPTGPETIKHNPYLHVPICFEDLEIFKEAESPFRKVSKHQLADLYDNLGPFFIEFDDDEARNVAYVHQSVLMMLFVTGISGATIEFYNWESDKEGFAYKVLAHNHNQLLLFISDTSCDKSVEDVYRAADYLKAVRNNILTYPTKSEWSWSQEKVGDIRTLNDVAREANSWRPKTCFGLGVCSVTQSLGSQMVLKRSHSCAGRDVKVVPTAKRDKLLCKTSKSNQSAKRIRRRRNQGDLAQKFIYFHQEYVPAFQNIGEFRIWVCGGRVLCAFRTKDDVNSPDKPMALWQLDTNDFSDFNWYSSTNSIRKRKHDELLNFVLETDSRIQQLRNDKFDTVIIGARYDCGVSPDQQFYINELTRFTNADTFSGLLTPPHDQIIGPLARMIAQKILA